tara:strand:+ start:2272 stop:2568 length:297 start_codon:yes stop_codon:yes gene_type:complete
MTWENIIKRSEGEIKEEAQQAQAIYARKREEVKKLSLELIDTLGDWDTGDLFVTEKKIIKDIKQIQDDMEKIFEIRIKNELSRERNAHMANVDIRDYF